MKQDPILTPRLRTHTTVKPRQAGTNIPTYPLSLLTAKNRALLTSHSIVVRGREKTADLFFNGLDDDIAFVSILMVFYDTWSAGNI
jgi:hypothetical protein